jgi:hypothetical protein
MDLLEYAQKLIKSGDNPQQQQAYQLQAVLQNGPIKNEQQPTNSKLPWVIGGMAVISLAVIVGYLLGKRKKKNLWTNLLKSKQK